MEVFKPRQEQLRQKTRKRKQQNRPRGAVIKSREVEREAFSLRMKKRISDVITEIERITGFVNKWVLVSLVSVVVLSAIWVSLGSIKAEMPIEKVSVKGDFKQLNKSSLEKTLYPLVGTNYFDLDVQKIKTSLLAFAWVQSVEVRKKWPAQVEVTVVENKAIAAWGADALVNEKGKVFKPKTINRSVLGAIPDLNGNEKQSALVLETYAGLAELSALHGLKISEFSLVSNSFWKLQFDGGPELFLSMGRERESIKTFLKAYEMDFKPRDIELARVDLRYSNGFAVERATRPDDRVVVKMKSNNQKTGKDNG